MGEQRKDDPVVVAAAPGPRALRWVAGALGLLILIAAPMRGGGCSKPVQKLPAPLQYFTQLACLFPNAARASIDYRLEAMSCDEGRFRELDTSPHFPIHADDKENRFHRLGFFHRRDRTTLEALESYVLERHNGQLASGVRPGDGVDGPIGGIALLSLRIPIPEPGAGVERYERRPLASYPTDIKKFWYRTPKKRWEQRCQKERP